MSDPTRGDVTPDTTPTLGIVLMEDDAAVEGSPQEFAARGVTKPWVVQDPDHWGLPIRTAVAAGATAGPLLGGEPDALRGVVEAVRRLDGKADLIIGNCGFMWAAREQLVGSTATPAVLSGLDLLDVALRMTSRSVGVVTYSASSLDPLLAGHPERERICRVGLEDLPDWAAISAPDFMERGGWSLDGLAAQLCERLARELADGGELADAGVLVLECTALPNLRSAIRSVTRMPVLDVVSFGAAALA